MAAARWCSPAACLGSGEPANDGTLGRLRWVMIHLCLKLEVDGTSGYGSHALPRESTPPLHHLIVDTGNEGIAFVAWCRLQLMLTCVGEACVVALGVCWAHCQGV